MDHRISVDQANISYQGDHFDLLSDRDLLVGFLLAIEPSEKRFVKSPNCREMAGFKLVVFRELSQPGHKLVVFAIDNGVGSGTSLG
jgi:hypothetical protein